MWRTIAVILVLGTLLVLPKAAQAEWYEHTAGGQALLVLPQMKATSATSFASTGFGAQAHYGFGILHDIYLVARFGAWTHDGVVPNVTKNSSRGTFAGDLAFHGEGYRAELGLKYKVISGFNLTPYLDAFGGYQWTTFRGQDLRNAAGGSYGLSLSDTGRTAPTAGGGASLEYRLFNMMLVQGSAFYSRVWDEAYKADLSLGLSASFSWF